MKILISLIVTCTVIIASPINENMSCSACHGSTWQISALNKSRVVKNMSHSDIEESLISYKNYINGSDKKNDRYMKLMRGQISNYSINEIKEFSKKIGQKNKK